MTPLLETEREPQKVVIEVDQGGPKGTWGKVWAFLRKYILGPIPALIVVAVAILLVMLGVKNLQIGGLLGAILGRKDSKKAVDVANTVPKGRVREDGSLIKPGEPDSKGITQAKVVKIKKPGLFDDPTKVKIQDPDTGKNIEVDVPDGVKAKDVDQVIVVRPDIHAVTVRIDSPVTALDVDDLLNKYGKP